LKISPNQSFLGNFTAKTRSFLSAANPSMVIAPDKDFNKLLAPFAE
jgi:hypothetical protein